LGEYYFSAVLIESDEMIAYQFTHENSNKKYIIAWIPNSQDPEEGKWFTDGFNERVQQHYVLDGKPNNIWLKPKNQNEFFLSGYPRIFEISH